MGDFLNLLIDADYVRVQYETHPLAMWALTVFVFALGVSVGYGAGRWRSRASGGVGLIAMARTWRVLNERELWCLAHVWETYPKKFSMSGDLFVSDFRTLVDAGILRHDGDEEHGGQVRRVYTIAVGWRGWVARHAGELPDPTSEVPS